MGKILGKGAAIGDYGVLFNKFSEWRYKALTAVHAYGIRKRDILDLLDEYPDIAVKLRQFNANTFRKGIREPLLEHREETL